MTFALVVQDDLGEGYGGEVFTGAPVDDLDVLATPDQLTDALERDVPARGSVVQLAVGVFLDEPRGRLGVSRGFGLISAG